VLFSQGWLQYNKEGQSPRYVDCKTEDMICRRPALSEIYLAAPLRHDHFKYLFRVLEKSET